MKKNFLLFCLAMCMTLSLCACTASNVSQQDDDMEQESAVEVPDSVETPAQLQMPELTDVDPVAVLEIPIYEDIPLADDETIDVLDIGTDTVFLAVNTESELEQGLPRTKALVIYEMDSQTATTVEHFDDIDLYVTAGRMVENDYIYTAILSTRLIDVKGVVRRAGDSPWEVPFDAECADGECLPEPFVMPSGDVVFVLCGEQADDGSTFRVVSVSPDGTARVIFTPEDHTARGFNTMMIPYQSGYMFRYATASGWQFCVGDEKNVSPFSAVIDCRAVYPWWACKDDVLLLAIGFGDDTNGITSMHNAVVTREGAITHLGNLRFMRFTMGSSGKIAAVTLDWEQYLLTFENNKLSAVRIDLPATATEFFRSSGGRLYAHLSNPRLGRIGLFEINE